MSKKKEVKNNLSLHETFPFLSWVGLLKSKKILRKDIIAGISVAIILIPQSMAYAQLAGLPIEVGLYTAFLPVIVAALFGSSHQMSTGPVTIVSLMTATAIAPIAIHHPEGYVVYASLLAFFIGLFYLLLGTLKLGVIVDFLSHPVIIGFTNAIAIVTITSQIPKILGISIAKGGNYIETLYLIVQQAFSSVHLITIVFGIIAIGSLVILSKIAPKTPRVLIVLIFSIVASYFLGFNENFGGTIVGSIPSSLPGMHIPFINEFTFKLSFEDITRLWISAMIIGLIGFTESISVAKFVGYKTKHRVGANRELIGQGLANVTSSLFGGYGVAGSFSKTAVNMKAGAKTGFSSVVTGLMVGFTLLFLTPLLYHLPMAILSAIIIVAVFNLIKIEPIIKAWKVQKHDGIIAIITFILTLFFVPDIEKGLIIGIILSLVSFIHRSMRPKVTEVAMYKDGELRDIDLFGLKASKTVSIYRFDGSIYFANAGFFEGKILEFVSEKKKLKFIILDMSWVNDIDSSGMEILGSLVERLEKGGIKIYLSGLRVKVIEKMTNVGFLEKFGEKKVFTKVKDAVKFIEKKHGKKADIEALADYSPDRKKAPELEKEVIKNIKKIS